MKKKFLCILLVLAIAFTCIFTLGACKPKSQNKEIALITDMGNIDDKSFNEGSWNAVKSYAQKNNKTYGYYKPIEDSTESRIETIKNAMDNGAKVIICPGYLFETPIYMVQDKYPDVSFLFVDGQPHSADYSDYKTGKNVHCILYKEEQAGYLAGYAAVKDGYRKLGFLGGGDVPPVKRFGFGYIQGADAAAKEDNLDDVEMKYWYSGSFIPKDDIKTKMDSWYTSGTEVVFSCGGSIYLNATAAAKEANKKVIGVDVDQANVSDTVITSAMKDLTRSVEMALKSFYDNNGKWNEEHAGKTAVLGVKENCVGLPTNKESWRLKNFTVEDYKKVYQKLVDGTIVVDNTVTKNPTVEKIKVDFLNE